MVGNLEFSFGDYLLIPRGMIYQIEFDDDDNRFFIVPLPEFRIVK